MAVVGWAAAGQRLGTWAYVAPDWSADWLHREATWLADFYARQANGGTYAQADETTQAQLQVRLRKEMRTNTYDEKTGALVVSPERAQAIAAVGAHYTGLFGNDPALASLRNAYAIPENSIQTVERQKLLNAFFFWAAWVCGTNRPGATITYTNNWPAEALIGNAAPPAIILWSVFSFVVLLAGIGGLVWYFAALRHSEEPKAVVPERDPLFSLTPTPSMAATLKYFWVVAALIVVQIGLGALTAHYGVEGTAFFGIPLGKHIPYALTRTWHTQLGIFWIATAWLATGLFVAPALAGQEPKFQRAGVNFLFVCLLIIVVGSFFMQYLSIHQRLSLETGFWFGHQGYEYVDLGRFWQIFLFVGLIVWLALMVRALWPAISHPSEHRSMLLLFTVSAAAIGMFYGAGLMWGRQTNLAIAEYWRWWVVHLWVEGFFEVFAAAVISLLFTRLGLLRVSTATSAVLFSTAIFLGGGVLGTFHHLYFTGTPTSILALGATFSALEIVPLVLVGYEAYENLALSRSKPWVQEYKWPIYFFVAVAFWNLVGAGIFGFLINPPIALYFVQGLNTTAVHGHAALFGVYGMLAIGLMLFCLRKFSGQQQWHTPALRVAFWSLNLGLVLMIGLSLLPIGILQAVASTQHGMWYARSADFMQGDVMQTLRWMRAIGDSVFAVGALALVYFIVGLQTGWSLVADSQAAEIPAAAALVDRSY